MRNVFVVIFFIGWVSASISTSAQSAPDVVLKQLYAAAKLKSPSDMTKTQLIKYFDPDLAATIKKAAKRENGIDFDFLYNAQDTRIKNFRITKGSPQTTVISYWIVMFTNFGKHESITFELSNLKGKGWKISEIIYKDGSKLSDILNEP